MKPESHITAPMSHAETQKPHPMHLLGFNITPPPRLGVNASTGQALAQGGSLHALQTMTTKPFSMPPADLTAIADLLAPTNPNLLEQA